MSKHPLSLPFEWKKEGEKHILYSVPADINLPWQRIGSYWKDGNDWNIQTIFFRKTQPVTPASEPDVRQYVQNHCSDELSSLLVDTDSFINQRLKNGRDALLRDLEYKLQQIHIGTTASPGEFRKAIKNNAGDYKSIEALQAYDEKLFKRIDEMLVSLRHWKEYVGGGGAIENHI